MHDDCSAGCSDPACSLAVHVALLDSEGRVVTASESWMGVAGCEPLLGAACGPGKDYLGRCAKGGARHEGAASRLAAGIREVMDGGIARFSMDYTCEAPDGELRFRAEVSPWQGGGVMVAHVGVPGGEDGEMSLPVVSRDELDKNDRGFERQHIALKALTNCGLWLSHGELTALKRINETVAATLNVERVSVWRFNEDRSGIVCQDLYEASKGLHGEGMFLSAADFPIYFRCLAENDVIPAGDARRDPRTREFSDAYLQPLGITSMLDSPILIGGVLEGVLCVEHVGRMRWWTHGEQSFAVSVANLVSLLITQCRQARSEAWLRSIVENEPECVVVVSPEGRVLDMNPAGLRMIGADHAGTVGGSLFEELVCDDDLSEYRALHLKACGGETVRSQFRMKGAGAAERWVEAHATPLRESNGTISAVLSVARDVTERKLAERAVEEKTALLAAAQRIGRMGSWSMRPGSGRIELSDSSCGLFGTTPAGFDGGFNGFLEFFRESDHGAVMRQVEECSTIGIPIDSEFLINTGRGERRWLRWIGEAVRDDKFTIMRLQGAFQDVTDIKLARQERDRFFNQSIDMLCIADFDGRFELMNPAWSQCLGWRHDELSQHPWLEFVHPDDHEETIQIGEKLIQGTVIKDFENRYRCKDGSYRWLSWNSYPLVETRQIFAVARDVTDKKLTERKVRESEERFRNLLQGVPTVAIQGISLDGTIQYWNEASEKFYGYTSGEAIGRNLLDLVIPSETRDAIRHALGEVGRRGVAVPNCEVEMLRKDGSRITVFTSHAVVRRVGHPPELFRIDVDLTERKRHERALKLLSRCNEVLSGSVTEQDLLSAVCTLAVDIGGYRMARVGFAMDDEACSIVPVAFAGDREDCFDTIPFSWAEDSATGGVPASRAIRAGGVVVCEDIQQENTFTQWHERAMQHGFRGVICLPLRRNENIFGVLGLYSASVVKPAADELKLLQELADNLAVGIGRIRAQTEASRMRAAIQQVAASVSSVSDDKFFANLTSNMISALGAAAGFTVQLLHGKPHIGRFVAAVVDGRETRLPDFVIEGTPCGLLLERDDLVVSRGVLERFPAAADFIPSGTRAFVGRRLVNTSGQPVGMLFLLFREHFRESESVTSTLRVFAIRVAAELERLKVDALLREQASLLDKAQDAIIVRDLEHRVFYWNKSAERLYGWKAEEVIGRSIVDLLYHDPSLFLKATETTLSKGEWVGEIEQVTKSGGITVVEGHWSLVCDDVGNPKSVLAINTDITERKSLERQFLRAQRIESIGTLAGGIAHDLNNVLSPIMMSIELLRNYVEDPSGQEILNLVGISAKRGAEMVTQVLSFARGVEGQAVEIRFAHIVRDLVRIVEETFPKNIQIGVILQPDLWTVRVDPTQLHQVLVNLCVNSRDAMPEGGHIIIKAENVDIDEQYAAMNLEANAGPYLRIDVEDTGHGIPSEIIDKLFDPFFTTKPVGKGTGLGLSTSLAIIKSHGGFIRAYSELGNGARFRIYLPAIVDSDPAAEEHARENFPRGQGETVLVVDDEASIRLITKQTLEAFGYRVLLASDGSEAISVYVQHQHEIAVVLTDMMMPVMDGPATINVLRHLNPGLRIIGASGINANGRVAKAENAGANMFLPKPYTADTLLKAIRSMLSKQG